MNEYQRPKQIHISDLLLYYLEKWRWIVASMLIAAAVAGTYAGLSTMRENRAKQAAAAAAETTKNTNSVDAAEEDAAKRSVGSYAQAIEEIERDLKIQEDYLENSVVMQLEPFHISTGTLSYHLEGGDHAGSLISAYNVFISSGRLAEELYTDNDSVSVEDLRYLITFDNYGNSTEPQNPVFQITIKMPDGSSGEVYLKRAKEIMEEYALQLQTQVGEHRITLLDYVQSEMADLDIQQYQSSVRSTYMASVRNLKALQTEAKTDQVTSAGDSGNDVAAVTVALEDPISAAVHSAVQGLVLGAGLSFIVLVLWYLFGNRLQDMEAFKRDYDMALLGIVRTSGAKKKKLDMIDAAIFRLRGGFYGKVGLDEQIKIAADNVQAAILKNASGKEIKKLMLAGTMAERDMEAFCSRLASEMPSVSVSSYKRLLFHSLALKELADYDGVIFLEQRGVSDSGLVMQERRLALDRDVEVLGTIIMC